MEYFGKVWHRRPKKSLVRSTVGWCAPNLLSMEPQAFLQNLGAALAADKQPWPSTGQDRGGATHDWCSNTGNLFSFI